MLKLYGQQNGSKDSKCYSMMWGSDADSLRNNNDVEYYDIRLKKE